MHRQYWVHMLHYRDENTLESIPRPSRFVVYPIKSEWVSERASLVSASTHCAILPGRYPIPCPRRHQYGKESTANRRWIMCTRRSIKRQMVVTIRIWKKWFRAACHAELACCRTYEIFVNVRIEKFKLAGDSRMSGLRVHVLKSLRI